MMIGSALGPEVFGCEFQYKKAPSAPKMATDATIRNRPGACIEFSESYRKAAHLPSNRSQMAERPRSRSSPRHLTFFFGAGVSGRGFAGGPAFSSKSGQSAGIKRSMPGFNSLIWQEHSPHKKRVT